MCDPYWTYRTVRDALQHYARLRAEVASPSMGGTAEGHQTPTRGADPKLPVDVKVSIDGAIERAPLTRRQRDVVIGWIDGELVINAIDRLDVSERTVYYDRANAAEEIAAFLRGK